MSYAARRITLILTGSILAALLAAAGFVALGAYNVAATSPHFAFTRWLLEFGMVRSVMFHASGIEAPHLDDASLVERGHRHFESACANCHGEIGVDQFGQQLLPTAPPLSIKIPDWSPAELFWIVKHGIKMTGMPSWEAQGRDDEVWAIVAFLLRLPEVATEPPPPDAGGSGGDNSNGALIAAAGPPAQALAACSRCHGLTGEGSPTGAFPRLSFQGSGYLYRSLKQYANGDRPSGIMAPVARALSDQQMRSVADHYAASGPATQAPLAAQGEASDGLLIQRGGALAAVGDVQRGIEPCIACHGDEGIGTRNAPVLSGQYRGYLEQQLMLWKQGLRDRDRGTVMTRIAKGLTAEEIRAVATYFAALPPRTEPLDEQMSGGAGTWR
jgi:cytochrome c553